MVRLLVPVFFLFALSSCRVGRSIIYNVADIRDHKKFPSRPLVAAAEPFRFIKPSTPRGPIKATVAGKDISFDEYLRQSGTLAFVILHGNTVLYERYFDGYDSASLVPSFSVAKSVTSILIGCAIADGAIMSVEQPITDFIPELKPRGFNAVTVRHLLQQTSGLRFCENYYNPFGGAAAYYYGSDLRTKIKRLRLKRRPGEAFEYTSGNTQLLGLVLERAIKSKTVTQYAQEKLWTPMGAEHLATWSIDRKKKGLEKTFCCLNMAAIDYAKIGKLYRDGGRWNGRQLVPEAWVRESTKPDTTAGGARYYKYQWWLPTPHRGDYVAQGHLGQYIYVNPAADMVIVRLGRREGKVPWVTSMRSLAEAYGARARP